MSAEGAAAVADARNRNASPASRPVVTRMT